MSDEIRVRITIEVTVLDEKLLWLAAMRQYSRCWGGGNILESKDDPKLGDAAIECLILSTEVQFDQSGVEITDWDYEVISGKPTPFDDLGITTESNEEEDEEESE